MHDLQCDRDLQDGMNLAVYSAGAEQMSLCLFTEPDLQQGRVTREVLMDPVHNKTGDVWHITLPGLDSALLYGKL